MFKKEMLIDGKGHLLGRLASVVAKEILSGQQVVCDRYSMLYVIFLLDYCPMRGYQHFRIFVQKQP